MRGYTGISGGSAPTAGLVCAISAGLYNPRRRHTSIDSLSPVDYERLYTAAVDAA